MWNLQLFKNPIASLQTQEGFQMWLGIRITRGIFEKTGGLSLLQIY